MDLVSLGVVASLGLAAIGSAYGCSIAGMAVVGVWKKGFLNGKSANPLMFVFSGTALSQSIYGLIVMNALQAARDAGVHDPILFWVGILGGAALGLSAVWQAQIACAAADSLGETGKGFAQYLIAIGIVETVALFVMIFMMGLIPSV